MEQEKQIEKNIEKNIQKKDIFERINYSHQYWFL